MKNKHDIDSALAAEYALGTLRGAARLRFMHRIEQDPELAAEVQRWQNALSVLDSDVMPVAPPETLWSRIISDLPAEPQHNASSYQPAGQPVKISRSAWPLWLGWGLPHLPAHCFIPSWFRPPCLLRLLPF